MANRDDEENPSLSNRSFGAGYSQDRRQNRTAAREKEGVRIAESCSRENARSPVEPRAFGEIEPMSEQRFSIKILVPEISLSIEEALASEMTVTFAIEPDLAPDTQWTVAKTLGGEKLLCAMRLQREGSAEVSATEPWLRQHVANLRSELIDLALERFEFYPPVANWELREAS